MSRSIRAAVVQIAAHDRTSLAASWPAAAARIREAASAGAQLIVLPEGTLPAYVLGYERFEPSEIAGALEECRSIAREHAAVVVVGAARREGGRVYNSAIVIDADGSPAGSADKHFLWHFDRQWFAPGQRLEPVRTRVGAIGALVCADGRIPTIARTLVDRGAEILVMPTAWVTSGRDPANLENAQADLMARVRARENNAVFLAANKCGVELGCVAYCGKSQILRADGTPVAVAAQDREQTLIADLVIEPPRPARAAPLEAGGIQTAPGPVRLAVTARTPEPNDAELLRIVEARTLVYGDGSALPDPGMTLPLVEDETVLDPGGLAALRLRGADIAVWRTSFDPAWQTAFARTRALELRMYLIVVDAARQRAYAVDPDGAIICGTFGEYRIAGFGYDPARTRQTLVAPGTDVRAGLERAARHATP